MGVTVTVSRTSLSLPDLVLTEDSAQDFWLPEDGLEEPSADYRRTYMPDHPDIHGRELLAAVLEHDAIPLAVYARGASGAGLRTNKNAIRAAFGQFQFDLTVDVDGDLWGTYSAEISAPKWSTDSGMVRAHLARASLVVPVYPIAS